jgi:biopolymer transport protein ExbB
MMRLLSIVFYSAFFSILSASNLDGLKMQHEKRLEQSLAKLAKERKELKDKVIPLLGEIRSLKTEEKKWINKIENLQSVDDSKTLSMEDLKYQVEALERELNHLNDVVIKEFMTEEQSSLPSFHPQKEKLRKMDLAIESGEVKSALITQLKSITDMAKKLDGLFDGSRFKTKVLDTNGVWVDGEVIDIGPEHFFSSPQLAGRLMETEDNRPQVRKGYSENISKWYKGESETLPLDVSGGDALSIEESKVSAVEHIKKGGMWVYPIIGFAILAAFAATLKSIALYTTRLSLPKVGHQLAVFLREGAFDSAKELAEKQPNPSRNMWLTAIERGKANAQLTEEVIDEVLMELQPKYERFLSFIAVTAAIAPLLGLLGTVTGIIKTFQMMEVFGAGDPKPLIGGISEALITTELGLILAIPALLFHAMLSRKAKSIMAKLERSGVAMVNGLIEQKTHSAKEN